ncbi:MaoC family dehydratase [Bacillus atrophaeus]
MFTQGETFGPIQTPCIDKQRLIDYAEASGDRNVIHLEVDKAVEAGFEKEVVHGMLSMGMVHSAISSVLMGQYTVRLYDATFVSPLYIDETLFVSGLTEEFSPAAVTLLVEAKDSKNRLILTGTMYLDRIGGGKVCD